ncbi:MAG: rhomboid family intramembrane serine protease [Bacillota bacterium]|jgi:membrane associated rhomboid family serine protease
MIPLRDCLRPKRTPYVNMALILSTTLVFLWEAIYLSSFERMELAHVYGLIPLRISLALEEPGLLLTAGLTFFSSIFLHSGWLHLIGNMLYLWIFGDNVEDRLGHARYFFFYLAAGALGGAAQVYSDPYLPIPVVGASGAIAGVLGAYLLSFPQAKIKTLIILFIIVRIVQIPAIWFILIWFGLQLVSGLSPQVEGVAQVAWWAHIGGFIGGIILLWLMRPKSIEGEEIEC